MSIVQQYDSVFGKQVCGGFIDEQQALRRRSSNSPGLSSKILSTCGKLPPSIDFCTFAPLTGTNFLCFRTSDLLFMVTTLVSYLLDGDNSVMFEKRFSEYGWLCSDNRGIETCNFAVTMHLDSAKDRVITKFRRLDGCAQIFKRVVQQFCEYRNVAGHARRVNAMTKVESTISVEAFPKPRSAPEPRSFPSKVARTSNNAVQNFAVHCVTSTVQDSIRICKMYLNWLSSDPIDALQSLLKAMPKLWADFNFLSVDAPFSASSTSGFVSPEISVTQKDMEQLWNAMSALYAALCLVVAQCLHALQTSEQSARAAACAAASASPASVSVSVPAVASSSSSSNNSSDNKHWRTAAAVQRALEQQQQKKQQLHHQQQQEEEQGGAGFFCSYAEATAARDDTATVYRAISFAETSSFSSFSSFSLPPSSFPAADSYSSRKGLDMHADATLNCTAFMNSDAPDLQWKNHCENCLIATFPLDRTSSALLLAQSCIVSFFRESTSHDRWMDSTWRCMEKENAHLKRSVMQLPVILQCLVHSSSSLSTCGGVPAMERDVYAALSEQSSCRVCPSSPSSSASAFSHGSSSISSSGSSCNNIGGSDSAEACAGCYMCDHTRKNLALLREIEYCLGC